MAGHGAGGKPGEVDMYRDTWVRYLGYANEVGEAFRPLVPPAAVWATYGVSTMYVLADTRDKVLKAQKRNAGASAQRRQSEMAIEGIDTCLWQGFASVIVPGFTIHQIVKYSKKALVASKASQTLTRSIPTAVGLGVIPFIVHPIDSLVDAVMDRTVRPAAKTGQEWYLSGNSKYEYAEESILNLPEASPRTPERAMTLVSGPKKFLS